MLKTDIASICAPPAHVIAFPASTPLIGSRQPYFLFSVRQVVDVLNQVEIRSIASDLHHIRGVALWRGRMVPVVCLEASLGLRTLENGIPLRTIVVRGLEVSDTGEVRDLYAICKIGAAVRQFQLPIACRSVARPERLPGVDFLSGVYVMDEYLFMVVRIESVLAGFNNENMQETVRVG